ncbi:Inner membrane protein YedI [Burkholderiales bacterium]|nr:Inner membrane protein YedI [Burkholderiales bacterium]
MAGASLLALLDDIASILDDVAVMTKVAAKKTAGVVGDDLAVNADQVSGVRAERELPVVWAVGVGSFKNKLILVPAALLLSAFAPWVVLPLLMLGGFYLCFEGVEKIAHHWLHRAAEHEAEHQRELAAVADPEVDLVAFEREKIQGAIRTDFVLSAEIIIIALGTVADRPFLTQVVVLSAIGVAMTFGVYGLVAAIVKADDLGLYLTQKRNALLRQIGRFLLAAAPRFLKSLTVIGTLAMFLVGGSILAHGLPPLHHAVETAASSLGGLPGAILPTVADLLVGLLGGVLALGVVSMGAKIWRRARA